MNTSDFHAALDLSGPEVALALAADGKIIFEAWQPMRGHSAAALLPWIEQQMQAHQLALTGITRWTVGSGPGSFSGLRMAAALVQGLTFGRCEVKTRTLPTALGLAFAVKATNVKIACLFDGRNHELLLFGAQADDQGMLQADGVTMVIDREQAPAALANYERTVAFVRDRDAVAAILPEASTATTVWVEHLPIGAMTATVSDNWNNDLTSLVYIRQAVFAKPCCS